MNSRLFAAYAVFFFGCSDPPAPVLTVNCSRQVLSDGISVSCGDQNTINGSPSDTEPMMLCADSNDCRSDPMVCEAYIHCRAGICLCNNIKLSTPECEGIEDCPKPLEQYPNCSRRSCWEGVCGFHPYTADQEPCDDND